MSAEPADFLVALARDSCAAAVLVVLVLVTQHVFRKQLSPHWRCALWLLVVARLLPISFSSDVSIFNLLPGWATGSFPATVAAPIAALSTDPLLTTVVAPMDTKTAVSNRSAVDATDGSPDESAAGFFAQWSWPVVLFLGWLAGVVVLSGYVMVVSLSMLRSLVRLKPLEDSAVLHVLHECCDRMGLRRAPVLMASAAVRTPALHGLWRPRLLLPVDFAATYSAEEQRFVFLHELAHLRRRDLLLNWLVTGLQIVHWFNPLVWFGFARWRVDREIACDAAAIEAAGADRNRAYGETMLRLLQNLAVPNPRPGLVGILEDKRQLQRRMTMIALFAPARRPFVAAGLLAILAMVGLTDAQVAPAPVSTVSIAGATTPAASPGFTTSLQPDTPYVLFLVNGAETMLGPLNPAEPPGEKKALEPIERGRPFAPPRRTVTTEQTRASLKWQRAAQTLQAALVALSPGTAYHVVVCRDASALSLGTGLRDGSGGDAWVIDGITQRLRNQTPAGAFDLEIAFGSAGLIANASKPARIVLITDGLPTAGEGVRSDDSVTEAQRIKLFETATKTLPPRIPVHTFLLPMPPGDPGAAGLYWELAHATQGGLTCPARPGAEPRTHLAFVLDTSGSMRDPNRGGLWSGVISTLEIALDAHPQLAGIQLLDGDGRFILGRKGTGAAAWLPNTPETRDAIKRVLRRYDQDTVSNPVPGINNAIRFLRDKDAADMRMGICVFGDEFNSSDRADVVMRRLDELNPADATGKRAIVINAFGFPTTIRYQFSMGNTGLRFANLMRIVADEHGGTFIALPEL